ncbi:MAG: hypothetical protein ACLFRM_09040 [Guyparkeria sp.]|uniref:hypothetical protein n=1 Tax=Guyparkeria sp. TaxID=2035736 RepID=UPI003979D75E
MTAEPGVCCLEPATGPQRIHFFEDDHYGLDDIPEMFRLGTLEADPEGRVRLALAPAEIRELKVMADAYSFDMPEGLVHLIADLHRFAGERGAPRYVFVEVD